MNVSILRIVTVLLLAGWPSPSLRADGLAGVDPHRNCLVVRAAYDVGSSSTKVKVARVDPCSGRIVEVLLDEAVRVDYQSALGGSVDGRLNDQIMAQGLISLRELKVAADAYQPSRHTAVATAAFRQAVNAEAFVEKVREDVGIDLRVISQGEEAMLGFHAAAAATGIPRENAIVWNIGGGSMQMVAGDEAGRFIRYEGHHASVTFRNRLIEEIQGRSLADTQTPNPISEAQARQARELAHRLASEIPPAISARLHRDEAVVLGIGGVHFHSIRGQLQSGDRPYTQQDIVGMLASRLGQSDEQIAHPYAATEVSNLILVLGYMESLGIDSVLPLNTTMSDGLLVE